MPGKLYFYTTFSTIKRNVDGSKVKQWGRPLLRDLEWEFFLNWEEARGFSGFSEDEEFSCHRTLKEFLDDEVEVSDFIRKSYPEIVRPNGKFKRYKPAAEYLRTQWDSPKGRPLYTNMSKNLIMMGSRGFGKSYSTGAGIVAHEFLFDGKTVYDDVATSAEIVVGAGDAKYSGETLDKAKVALEQLPGEIVLGSIVYPAPFYKRYAGS